MPSRCDVHGCVHSENTAPTELRLLGWLSLNSAAVLLYSSAPWAILVGQCGYQVSLRSFTELHPIMHVYAQEAPLQSISAFLVYIKAFKFFNKVRRPDARATA